MKFIDRVLLCWKILKAKRGKLFEHAEIELPKQNCEMQNAINNNIKEIIFLFSTQGHSNLSASYAKNTLNKLLNYEPLSPLTGEPSEWVNVGNGLFQNKRCSRIFKDVNKFNGQAYDINGRVFKDANGKYTNNNSITLITFPYTPTTDVQFIY